jgi:hypothetical protein
MSKTLMALLAALIVAALPAHVNAAEEKVIARGEFVGKSGHKTSGGVRIVKMHAGVQLIFDPDFRFDGAPDPKIGFGRDGYDPSTKIAPLAGNKGQQVYGVPPTVDTSAYNEVWVWCEKYAVPLGVAKLK